MLREHPQSWTPSLSHFRSKIGQDWALIVAGYLLFLSHPNMTTFVGAIFLMSWGQKGLSTLAHDSIHRNLFRSKVRRKKQDSVMICH
jgi:hypothetical protein